MDYTVHAVAESDTAEQFLHTHTLPSIHDYWKNHSFDYIGKVIDSVSKVMNISTFQYAV